MTGTSLAYGVNSFLSFIISIIAFIAVGYVLGLGELEIWSPLFEMYLLLSALSSILIALLIGIITYYGDKV